MSRVAELRLAERQRSFDAYATAEDGMITVRVSVAEADRWLKLYEQEWLALAQAVEAARAGNPAAARPRCSVCDLRIRPAGDGGWLHWHSQAGRLKDADHKAELAVTQ